MSSFGERAALERTLSFILEKRARLADEFKAQDQKLKEEIEEIYYRLRELDKEDARPMVSPYVPVSDFSADSPGKRGRTRRNNKVKTEIVPIIESILREQDRHMTAKEIFAILQARYGYQYSNRSVVMNNVIKYNPKIKKVGHTYYLEKDPVSSEPADTPEESQNE